MNYLTDLPTPAEVHAACEVLQRACHGAAQHWWFDPKTGVDIRTNPLQFSNKIALAHSELSESLEGDRKNKMDEHLSHRQNREVELGDCVIRCFDTAGGFSMDLAGAIVEKMAYNAQRADHKTENRIAEGGKAY